MKIIYTGEFRRAFKKLSRELQDAAFAKEKIFRSDPFDNRLRTHKLSGKLKGCFSFSTSYSTRIIFEFDKNKSLVYFHSIGTHDIYK